MPKNKSNPSPSNSPVTRLPKHLEDFAQLLHSGVSQTQSAIQIGKSPASASYLARRPDVKQRLAEIKAEYARQLTENKAAKTIAEIPFDRNDIIVELWKLGTKAESERARVAALLGLSDIFLLRAKNVRELKEFYGWTADELKEYSIHGTIPERFRSLVGEGEGAGLGATASLRTDKK